MRASHRGTSGGRLRWLLLAPLMLTLMACEAACSVASPSAPGATATSTIAPQPSATLDVVSTSQTFTDSMNDGGTKAPCANGDPIIRNDCGVTVTATCPNGESVVSGGYSTMPTSSSAFSSSNYPSTSGTWTVTIHDEGNGGVGRRITVTATVNCLKANFPTTTQIVTDTTNVPADGNAYTVPATCPSGTVLTGGYRGSFPGSSMPSGNSWSAQIMDYPAASAGPKVYAVCADAHVQPATVVSAPNTFALIDTPTLLQACPAGTTLVGGGFEFGQGGTGISANQATGDGGWQVLISGVESAGPGSITVTVYAVCATFA